MSNQHILELEALPLRRWFVLLVLGAGLGVMAWRALDLRMSHGDFLQSQGDARHLRVIAVPAHRGMILDRNGEPLAVSTPVESIWANPGELAAERERWPELARALGIEPARLENTLGQRAGREFVYLKRHVQPDAARQVRELGIGGIYTRREYRRYYPTGEVTGHVLGFTNIDDVGQEGLELAFDDWLRGVDGSKRVLRDRLGRVVENLDIIRQPRAGRDLTLSIDRRIQYFAYRALFEAVQAHGARGGTAVVLDVNTGEILAMVNQPSFNPNNRAGRSTSKLRNRAVTDVFEPGSTVKPFTVLSGLKSGQFEAGTMIDTAPGFLKVGRYTIRDHHNYGAIDLSTVISKSSNVGASKVALAVSPEELWHSLDVAGFGSDTGSGFPGESAGILSSPRGWGDAHRVTMSFGYGLSVTALQLARAYAVLANGGLQVQPSFQRLAHPPEGKRVFAANDARDVTEMLERVVRRGGTGTRAAVPGYRVAGKTGTVRKSEAGGYSEDRYLALFAGFAPASDPRLAVVVVVDEPGGDAYYGGQIAAPIFSRIMAAGLRLTGAAPDDRDGLISRVTMAVSGERDFEESVQ